jgi:hypothetical protein
MKPTGLTLFRLFLVISMTGVTVVSCKKDEPYYQVDPFEMEIHNQVNRYRQSQGLSDLIFFHDLFVEARQQSEAWRNTGNPSEGFDARWQKIIEHWEPVNLGALSAKINGKDTTAARIVVDGWRQDSAASAIMLGDFIQSGPGIAEGEDGWVYITHFFMKIEE